MTKYENAMPGTGVSTPTNAPSIGDEAPSSAAIERSSDKAREEKVEMKSEETAAEESISSDTPPADKSKPYCQLSLHAKSYILAMDQVNPGTLSFRLSGYILLISTTSLCYCCRMPSQGQSNKERKDFRGRRLDANFFKVSLALQLLRARLIWTLLLQQRVKQQGT